MNGGKVLILTKEQAATRQAAAAIEAFFGGDYDIAITLAGAAENMLSRTGPHLFKFLLEHPTIARYGKKEIIATINAERDWLKHVRGPEPVQIGRSAAAFMIVRAATKIRDWPPSFYKFRDWIETNLDALADDVSQVISESK